MMIVAYKKELSRAVSNNATKFFFVSTHGYKKNEIRQPENKV